LQLRFLSVPPAEQLEPSLKHPVTSMIVAADSSGLSREFTEPRLDAK
jgi:hypothetical protein